MQLVGKGPAILIEFDFGETTRRLGMPEIHSQNGRAELASKSHRAGWVLWRCRFTFREIRQETSVAYAVRQEAFSLLSGKVLCEFLQATCNEWNR